MGTAQQENPVAQFKATSFEVSLTCEEARILAQGLEALRREYDEIAYSATILTRLENFVRTSISSCRNKCFLRRLSCSTPLVGGPGATPGLSYYHPLRVVIFIAMAIRKAIAAQLSNAAKALEKDQTKEQAGRLIQGMRISLANVIMPNIPLSK
jgi:hypothetical protein